MYFFIFFKYNRKINDMLNLNAYLTSSFLVVLSVESDLELLEFLAKIFLERATAFGLLMRPLLLDRPLLFRLLFRLLFLPPRLPIYFIGCWNIVNAYG